jgi:hypothetical protein
MSSNIIPILLEAVMELGMFSCILFQTILYTANIYRNNIKGDLYESLEFYNRVGGTCGTHGGGERCLQGFGWEARR